MIAHDIFTFLPMRCLRHKFFVEKGLAKIPVPTGKWVKINIADILPAGALQRPLMNFQIANEIPGNLAGGLGSCDVVADSRTASGYVYLHGSEVTQMDALLQIHFIINDCISFCPGNCGLKSEQDVTVPASRVEAMGGFSEIPLRVEYDAQVLRITGIDTDDQPKTPQTSDVQCLDKDSIKFEEVDNPPKEIEAAADEDVESVARGLELRMDLPDEEII